VLTQLRRRPSPRSLLVLAVSTTLVWLTLACGSTDLGEQREGFASNGDTQLRYVINLPAGPPPFPVVAIGQGSGNVRIDAGPTVADVRALLDLGYATIRYDKRGTGDSGGELVAVSTANSATTIPLLASDMTAVIEAARTDSDLHFGQFGLYGSSQDAWYLPLVAADDPFIDFIVINSGGVIPVGQQVAFEQATRIDGATYTEGERAAEAYTGPLGFDQRPLLRDLDIPLLYLWGASDTAMPLAPNESELANLQATGIDATSILYPDARHLLEDANYWSDVADWLAVGPK
jgi:pimeloyl-ACP methyl ester carboxylesterase